jgi:lipase
VCASQILRCSRVSGLRSNQNGEVIRIMAVLAVYRFGATDAKPLLALHGLTAHGRRWERLATERWADRSTLAVDLRGHGRSLCAPPWSIEQVCQDVVDTLDSLGLDSVDVVAHSYGGQVAMNLVARCPERVRRIVLLDPVFAMNPRSARDQAYSTFAFPGWETLDEVRTALRAKLAGGADDDPLGDVETHVVVDADGRYRFRYDTAAVAAAYGELARSVPLIRQSRATLLVAAEKAGFVTEPVIASMRAQLGSDLEIRSLDCGHMVYWERFEQTGELVQSFLSRSAM